MSTPKYSSDYPDCYGRRAKIVSEWAGGRKTFHGCKTVKAGEFISYEWNDDKEFKNDFGGFFDHINEIQGFGIVVQPYWAEGREYPDFATEIDLPEKWSEHVRAFFIPKEVYRTVKNYRKAKGHR